MERVGRGVLVFAVGLVVDRYRGQTSLDTLSVVLAVLTLLARVAVVLYMKIDELILSALFGPTEVGWYTAATRLTEICFFLPAAIASNLLPQLIAAQGAGGYDYRQQLQRSYDLQFETAYAIALPASLAAPWLIALAYGTEFAPSAPIMAAHVWSLVFIFLGVARGQWLVQRGHGGFYLVSTLSGAALNIGLNFVTIPRWGGVGVAVSTLVSYATAVWLSSYAYLQTRAGAAISAPRHPPLSMSTLALRLRALMKRFRSWKGLRVEPIPELAAESRLNRRPLVIEAALVADEIATPSVTLHCAGLMSTIADAPGDEEFTRRHIQTGLAVQGLQSSSEIQVPARTLSSLLNEHRLEREIDLLRLNVEGSQPPALRGLDLSRHSPRWICVEARDPEEIHRLLEPTHRLVETLTDPGTHRDLLYARR